MATAPDVSERPVLRGQEVELLPATRAWLEGLQFDSSEAWLAARASECLVPLLAALGAVLVMLVVRALIRQRNAAPRRCRWRKGVRRSRRLQRWTCRMCGADAFTFDGTTPKECERHLRATRL